MQNPNREGEITDVERVEKGSRKYNEGYRYLYATWATIDGRKMYAKGDSYYFKSKAELIEFLKQRYGSFYDVLYPNWYIGDEEQEANNFMKKELQ